MGASEHGPTVMNPAKGEVSSVTELLGEAADGSVDEIVVRNDLADTPTFRLSPGQALTGVGGAIIRFVPGHDGVEVSSDNRVEGLELRTGL